MFIKYLKEPWNNKEMLTEMVYTSDTLLTTDEKYGQRERERDKTKKYRVPRDNYWRFIYASTFH